MLRRFHIVLILVLCSANALGQEVSAVDSSHAKNPNTALYLSFLPGGGQIYNNRPLKALLFSATFIYFGTELAQAQQDYDADPTSSQLHRTRNDKIWLMALTWTLNIIDAYVDAQLWDFDNYDFESETPDSNIVKPKESEDK